MSEKILVSLGVEIPGRDLVLRHSIEAELDLTGSVVRGRIPGVEPEEMVVGSGNSTLSAVLDWLNRVNQDIRYVPSYMKAQELKKP